MNVNALNGREALVTTAALVLKDGRETSPRGMKTRELEHFSVEIRDPYDVLCTGIGAKQSRAVAASETLQAVGGFSDPTFSVKHAPRTGDFLNDEGEFDGAYGPRLRDQYDPLLKRLSGDRDTRQAVLSIWEPRDLTRVGSKDYPCTIALGFAVRRDRLNAHVVMRSNDVNWGFKNDIFVFTQMQCSLARVLGIEAGPYRHTSWSMHLYERDWEWAESLEYEWTLINDHPRGIGGVDAEDMMGRARTIAAGGAAHDGSERWYAEALGAD